MPASVEPRDHEAARRAHGLTGGQAVPVRADGVLVERRVGRDDERERARGLLHGLHHLHHQSRRRNHRTREHRGGPPTRPYREDGQQHDKAAAGLVEDVQQRGHEHGAGLARQRGHGACELAMALGIRSARPA
jgi:hypothetical protein